MNRSVVAQAPRSSPLATPKPITLLLRRWRDGDRAALDQLAPIVYAEVHRLARAYLRRERRRPTLGPTDLASDAIARLLGDDQPDWISRAHFSSIVARNLRRLLVENARRRDARKRNSGERPVQLDEPLVRTLAANGRSPEVAAIDDALTELEQVDARKARVIELRYFGGMSNKEIAAVLEVHENTIMRDMRLAEAWLKARLAT